MTVLKFIKLPHSKLFLAIWIKNTVLKNIFLLNSIHVLSLHLKLLCNMCVHRVADSQSVFENICMKSNIKHERFHCINIQLSGFK